MSKYIDAEKLIAEIRKRLKNIRDYMNGSGMKYKGPKYFRAQGKESAYDALFSVIDSLQQEQPAYFYCKYGGTMPLCADCERNHNNSSFKTEEITTWYAPSNGTKHCIDYIQQERPEVDLEKTVEFECIGKKVKMTVQELINYYIDSECVDVADECGF